MLILLILLLLSVVPAQATTIAYDGTTMASDSQYTAGDTKSLGHQKIFRIGNYVVGAAGTVKTIREFQDWLKTPTSPAPHFDDEFDALVWSHDGCFLFDQDMHPHKVAAPYAIGTGGPFAVLEMWQGRSAHDGVKKAIETDLFSGGDIQVMSLQ